MCRRSQLLVFVAINSSFALLAMRADAAPLIANWKLDEPTTMQPVLESVGTPGIGNGTYSAGVVVGVPGPFPQFGTAASFNGSSWAEVGGGSVLNMTNNFTVSA